MKKIIALLLIVAVAVGAFVTNPTVGEHKTAINEAIQEKTGIKEKKGILGKVGSFVMGQVSNAALDKCLTVEDYKVCSMGKIILLDKEKRVSFGIFGHVYTFNIDTEF